MFAYAHVKWFYGQSERAYYLNYFMLLYIAHSTTGIFETLTIGCFVGVDHLIRIC